MDILNRISNEMQNVSDIEKKLVTIYDKPKVTPNFQNYEFEGTLQQPEGYEVYDSLGRWLGSTGKVYQSLQPKDFLGAVLGNVTDCDISGLDLSKLTFNEYSNGRIIEFRLPTEIVSFKNFAGKQDETKLFLNFRTGFAGYGRTEIGLYSHRFICSNGMRIIKSEVELNVKHTINMNYKALEFCNQLVQTVEKIQETSKMWKELDSIQVNDSTVKAFAMKLANVKKDEKLSTKKQNILDKINESIEIEFKDSGSTLWGLLNGATRYTNHFASGCEKPEYIQTELGTGNKMNKLAQNLVVKELELS